MSILNNEEDPQPSLNVEGIDIVSRILSRRPVMLTIFSSVNISHGRNFRQPSADEIPGTFIDDLNNLYERINSPGYQIPDVVQNSIDIFDR